MARWEKKLAAWTDAGLVAADQRDRILAFERSGEPKNIAAFTVIGLGAVIIAIGVISLVAYNWERIPDAAKLATDFILLLVVAGAAFHRHGASRRIIFEIIAAVYFLLIGGSIGLISQVYHTGGELYEAATVWAAVTVPLVLASRGTIVVHLWMVISVIALQGHAEAALAAMKYEQLAVSLIVLFSTLPSVFGIVALVLRRFTDDDVKTAGRSFAVWALAGALLGSVFLSIPITFDLQQARPAWLASFIAVDAAAIIASFVIARKTLGRGIIVLGAGIALYAVMAVSNLMQVREETREITDAALFILLWFAAAFFLFRLEYRKLFNALIVGIGIRFLVVYFQVFTDLATTGFGLIVSGLALIGLCVLYIRKRESLYGLMERFG